MPARPESDLPVDSAKTRKVMSILADIHERSEGDEKTIIFSQFTSMLDLLEPFLKNEGVRYVRCELASRLLSFSAHNLSSFADDGSMNKIKREESLEKIRSSTRTKVILISFKAGSTGNVLLMTINTFSS